MNNVNNPRTISFEEIQDFIKNDLKTGNLYKVVSRKYKDWNYQPYILDLNKNDWFSMEIKNKNQHVVLCLDEATATVPARIPAAPIRTPTGIRAAPVTRPAMTIAQWDLWYSMFIKVLYENKVCLVHAGWLEKL